MRLSETKEQLSGLSEVKFLLPNGNFVPLHIHVTEVGQIERNFIDCGGTIRNEKKINFQLWEAGDYDHRLGAEKLLSIIELSERLLDIEDAEVEVEFQGETIQKYSLDFSNGVFLLKNTATDCLAPGKCLIPEPKAAESSCCSPSSGCC